VKKILAGACMAIVTLAAAPVAQAVSVTVRAEAKTANLIPATTVTLPAADVLKDGQHPCAKDSFGGALQAAVGDDWVAPYNAQYGAYYLMAIRGFEPQYPDYFALWVNHKYTFLSVCDAGLQEGDEVLALVDFCDYDVQLQTCTNDSVLPLALDVPATVTPGTPFTVTVSRYEKDGSKVPIAGATVTGAKAPATSDAQGKVALTVDAAGPAALRASKTNYAGIDASTCATTGSDGYCGTTKPGEPAATTTTTTTTGTPCVHDGDDGRCGTTDTRAALGQIKAVTEQQHFTRGPRTLSGIVNADPSGLKDVQLRLTRNDRGRCSRYDAKFERFVALKRCGAARGTWFSVGDRAEWSYLLPFALPRGRYVLDVRTTDNAGNVDATLQRGRNRVVFFVG